MAISASPKPTIYVDKNTSPDSWGPGAVINACLESRRSWARLPLQSGTQVWKQQNISSLLTREDSILREASMTKR